MTTPLHPDPRSSGAQHPDALHADPLGPDPIGPGPLAQHPLDHECRSTTPPVALALAEGASSAVPHPRTMPAVHRIHRRLDGAFQRSSLLLVRLLVWCGVGAAALIAPPSQPRQQRRFAGQRGQATTEYALVLLAAALVALLVVAWATAGGGSARIARLFNRVIDAVTSRV